MENKHNKDIIEQIVSKMKSMEELPYKEGSWERFEQQYGMTTGKKGRPYYWAASAAAILLAGFFTVQYWAEQDKVGEHLVAKHTEKAIEVPEMKSDTEGNASMGDQQLKGSGINSNKEVNLGFGQKSQQEPSNFYGYERVNEGAPAAIKSFENSTNLEVHIPGIHSDRDLSIASIQLQADESRSFVLDERNGVISRLSAQQAIAQQNNQEITLGQKKFNFNERFDLGVFVSPNSTNEKFNFGGGMLVSYNINKALSLRTGLAYNQYEVGTVKDPIANADVPVLAKTESIQKTNSQGLVPLSSNNAVILPNINAISGSVQAFEIPLEAKFKSKSGFYASTGVAYAVVLNQERYAHYIENGNSEVFSNGLPKNENEMQKAVKQVSKAIKTEEQNVSTNGFGGFVNMSIGKEMKMGKSFSVSVEPYLKLPVGNFKRTDMNYTNGGIRIITNF